MVIGNHARKRVSKRLGIPKASVEKLAQEAYERGKRRCDISGSLRRYTDYLVKKEGSKATDAIVYRSYVFLMAYDHLVTAWLLPEKYKNRKAASTPGESTQ